MMAVAALEEGVITRDTRSWNCDGMFWLGKTSWRCHHVHGSVNVVEALTVSCDEFFYNVGLKLGVERIHEWGTKMGLGQVTGIDLPGEVPAILPTPEWKREHYAEFAPEDPGYLSPYDRAWTKGDTVNLSIGQGYCSLTPLQLAVMTACMVNGGRRVRPYINSALGPELSEPFISAETLETVREGMRLCVEKMDYPRGTGRRAYIEGLETIGKTGTAQIVPREVYAGLEDEEIPYRYRDHAWFVAGVLNMEPRIAMCVLFEHGLHGSTGAAPLAHEALEYIYRDQLDDQRRMAALDAGE
jgi:penicillin-binding protein 2